MTTQPQGLRAVAGGTRGLETKRKADALAEKWADLPQGTPAIPLPMGAYIDIGEGLARAADAAMLGGDALGEIRLVQALLHAVVVKATEQKT
ncbi:MAG TPA: hypothetical protein VH088_06985 [Terriglobales bacterium]|nr:hypothetical protein [Terriglobales bacterium]